MDIVSFQFLLFALVAIALLRSFPSPVVRHRLVLLLNLGFLASFIAKPLDIVPLLGMLAAGYGMVLLATRKPRAATMGAMLCVLVALFIWFKRYSLLTMLWSFDDTPWMVVGLSYVLFRIIHLIVDVGQDLKATPTALHYINYCLFFPTFLSGPIARYEQFDAGMKRVLPALSIVELHSALLRISLGLILLVLCSAYASTVVEWVKHTRSLMTPDHHAPLRTATLFALTCLATFIKLYTNFSGSMHVVIGMARIAGFELPENFNKPYLARNFIDFWSRWHITLSEWIKHYLFTPLLTALTRRFPSPAAALCVGAISYFVAFFVVGVWHGSSNAFAIFGIMLGVGATTNKLWQQLMTKRLGKKRYKSLAQHYAYVQLSRGLTLGYIALALMCLWVEPGYIAANGVAWFAGIATLSLAILTLAIAAIGSLADGGTNLLSRMRPRTFAIPQNDAARAVIMAVVVWLVVNHLGAFGSGTPELVYKGF